MGLSLALGCQGVITDPGIAPGGGGGGGGGGGTGGGGADELPSPASRVPRLTHQQWENTVQDLFELPMPPGEADGFRPDPNVQGFIFDNNGSAMEVDQSLWSSYQRAASTVAEMVTSDPGTLDYIAPPAGDDATRARNFITDFGMRAYRRPLTDAEVDELVAVYDVGTTRFSGATAFEGGARLVIEAVLQSPFFLYRVELSTEPSGSVIPLNDYEIASRLSYALWNTMPDGELLDAAGRGELSTEDQIRDHAVRMLSDPRAEDVVSTFHQQLLSVYRFAGISPSSMFGADAQLPEYAEEEGDLFVRNVFASDGGYSDLLTSNDTFVNEELARIYGLEGSYPPDMFVPATLDETERRGIFTQVGFLASNATSVLPDPIHRGVFLAERISCIHIGAPPAMIPELPAPEGETNRQNIESHTQVPGCASCHETIINPYGFPFEMYDAVGALQDMDNGQPVDTVSSPLIDGANEEVADAIALVDRMAESPTVHECYTKHWVEYTFGRPETLADEALVQRLGELSLEGASIEEVIVALVTSRAFLNRSTEELPEVSP
jgi:hypothetical protein